MRKNMHHRIQHHGRHGPRGSDVRTQFHHTIRAATESEWRRIAEGKPGNSEFESMRKRKMPVVLSAVHDDTESGGIESVDNDPYTDHGGKIHPRTGQIGTQFREIHTKGIKHHKD